MSDRFLVASDHAAIGLRRAIVQHLIARGYEVGELGPLEGERADYPDQAIAVGESIVRGEATRGVLVCGTGIGMSIAANKVAGIRAALVHDPVTARLAGEHNAANVLCLGGRLLAEPYAIGLVDVWLEAAFEARHQVRLDRILAYERRG